MRRASSVLLLVAGYGAFGAAALACGLKVAGLGDTASAADGGAGLPVLDGDVAPDSGAGDGEGTPADGAVDSDAGSGDALVGLDAPDDASEKRVFVSSTASTGDLGGVAGADATCQRLADTARLGGTWRAWISNDTSSPSTRFRPSLVPYRLLDGTVVANDWLDLTKGSIRHSIDHTEQNLNVAGPVAVWTGTVRTGLTAATLNGGGCNGFTSGDASAPNAEQGQTDKADLRWTEMYVQFCDNATGRIYCFEQ